jgi:serine/threonine-protein kinase
VASTELPQIGEVIGDKYRVERVLGRGGMGAVFEATHRITGKRFAIKWMLPNLSGREDAVKRFVREAQVAGRFQHPNVVEVYDIAQHGEDSFYMVMELLEGESLEVRLEREGRLSLEVACRILLPCMRGVARAHAAGIVHRDLKPANLFLCRATAETPERPKVLDFGIAKAASSDLEASVTKAGTIMGTPHYMSPEGVRGEGGDHRTDIYAFGVILYELVAGRRPFEATSYIDLALKIATDTPESLVKLVHGTPQGFARVVSRAMARDPAQRYATVDELVQALEPYAAGLRPSDASVMSAPRPVASGSVVPLKTPLSTESQPSYPPAGMRPARSRTWTVIAVLAAVAALVWIARALLPGAVPTASPTGGEDKAGAPPPPPARAAASATPAPATHGEGSPAPGDAPQPAPPQPSGDGWVVPNSVVASDPQPAAPAPADPAPARARAGSDREHEARSRRAQRRRRDGDAPDAVDPPAPPASPTAPRKSAGRLGVALDEAEF